MKNELHPRNRHRGRYNFPELIQVYAALRPYVRRNEYGDDSIDFGNASAVLALNAAILKFYYRVADWSIPEGYLCPPIPGRADYIHLVADLLAADAQGIIPTGPSCRILDIGVGANAVYPLIGNAEYGWSFVGSEIDSLAAESALRNVSSSARLQADLLVRMQPESDSVFKGVIKPGEYFAATLCNPPFHASREEAEMGSRRKWENLGRKSALSGPNASPKLNFGGRSSELFCEGGELGFIRQMIAESRSFAGDVGWFTTLVSKEANLAAIEAALQAQRPSHLQVIPMAQGQKRSRIVAWTYS